MHVKFWISWNIFYHETHFLHNSVERKLVKNVTLHVVNSNTKLGNNLKLLTLKRISQKEKKLNQ